MFASFSPLVARVLILAISAAASTAVPYALQDRPVLRWTWDRFGPVVVDMAEERIDDQFGTDQEAK